MKKYTRAILILAAIVFSIFLVKCIIEHRTGYGAVNYENEDLPSGFLYESGDIPSSYLMDEEYKDIYREGPIFYDDFYCSHSGQKADLVKYYEVSPGYGITGGWVFRYAALCGDEYLIVDGADHFGEHIYGPFNLSDELRNEKEVDSSASDEALTEQPVEKVEISMEGEVLSPYITRVKTCDLSGTDIYDDGCWYATSIFLDENGERYPVPAGTVDHAGTGWVYMEENTIFTFDIVSGESQELMSVLDTWDGLSFEWSPEDSKLAIVVVNQDDESYHETYGSKLFVFSFDSEGSVLQKDRYLFKIKYGCHSAGCDSIAGEDFYFVDEDTLIYYTWEGDPYGERTEELKRTVEL